MRKMIIAILLVFVLLAACGTSTQQKLTMLEVGMSKQAVVSIMGQPKTSDAYGSLEIWYYHATVRLSSVFAAAADRTAGRTVDSEPKLLPIAFEDGRVIGWGEPFVIDKVKKYELRIR